VTVLPGTLVGAGDTGLSIGGLIQRVWDGHLGMTLPGGTSFVSSMDAAAGIQSAGLRGRPGESYIITGKVTDNLSYAAFMALVARVAREAVQAPLSGPFPCRAGRGGAPLCRHSGDPGACGVPVTGVLRSQGPSFNRFQGQKAEGSWAIFPRWRWRRQSPPASSSREAHGGEGRMSHAGYFRFLKMYSDIWARRHCRVVLSGEELLEPGRDRPRVYIVSHPVTWDLPMLAHIGRNNYYVIVDKGPFCPSPGEWLLQLPRAS